MFFKKNNFSCFFDEFDCTFQGKSLGWLRYFLVPMQDGKFLDHGRMHPIGKSIFVFAGGIYDNFKEFCASTGVDANMRKDSDILSNLACDILPPEKCPDFVSHLRGYVNILGLNPKDDRDRKEGAYLILRAILLRSLIERKAPYLITTKNGLIKAGKISKVKFDESLLELLLTGVKYKHEIRSKKAILDMSVLEKSEIWNFASLPSKEQLELYVEVDFSTLYKSQRKKGDESQILH